MPTLLRLIFLPLLLVVACNRGTVDISSFEECAAAGYPIMRSYPQKCQTPDGRTFVQSALIEVTTPMPNDLLQNELVVEGRARGMWYFEASFPIELLDGEGKVLVRIPVQAIGDWMTENWVPFRTTMQIPASSSATGTLVLRKNNASGLPEYDAELRIPVRFATLMRVPADEGEFCGGIAGFQCADGLDCVLDGDYPDAGGVCRR